MVQIIDVIKQLEVVIPSMMAAELLLTSTIKEDLCPTLAQRRGATH